jgi:hypothetical protein
MRSCPGIGTRRESAGSAGSVYGEPMRWWKAVGLAGVAGVAATGVVIARRERARRALTPEEVRDRLHQRYAAVAGAGGEDQHPPDR